jgi:hypothetical protein
MPTAALIGLGKHGARAVAEPRLVVEENVPKVAKVSTAEAFTTPEEADQLIPQNWKLGPTRGAGGGRRANPATKGSEQIRYQPGNPNDSDPVKRGAYFRYSSGSGNEWGPIPADGNPLA